MKKNIGNQIGYWLKLIIFTGILVFLIRGFLLIPMKVDGHSMEKTLSQDDQVVYEKISKIRRFDIVIFERNDGITYIKRVIGLPGETIAYKEDTLYVNGQQVDEPFLGALKIKRSSDQYTTNFDSKEMLLGKPIEADHYFVLGDNRRLSKDSRSFGTISADDIIGKARLVYFPFKHIKRL